MITTPKRYATTKQLAFLASLYDAREVPSDARYSTMAREEMSTKEASDLIGYLLTLPMRDAFPRFDERVLSVPSPLATTPGVYEQDGNVIQLCKGRQSGRVYAKVLRQGRYEYAPGLARGLRESSRISLDRACELSAQIGACVRCGRTLRAASSVRAGIGPICATYFA